MLLELNIPSKRRGFVYLEKGIRQYLKQPGQALTKTLYPDLAREHCTQPEAVERAIRHLIEVTWARGDWEVLNRYFGNTVSAEKGKPTNGEFIARMANVVNQRLREAA